MKKQIKKKCFPIIMTIIFLFQILASFTSLNVAKADEVLPKDITDTFHFITGVSIKDADGNELGNNIDKSSEIHVNYTWSIPNTEEVNEGDYYTMQLPKEIKIVADINEPINDSSGEKVADMHVDTSGLVTLTFTDYPSTHSNVSGYFYIDSFFDESEIGNNNPNPITFTIPGVADPIVINVNFNQPDPSIEKEGTYNPSTDEITWQLTVNKEGVNVNQATVEDTINAPQVFVEGSVTINGSQADESNYTYDSSSGKLEYNLGDITESQTLTFRTSVKDDLSGKGQGDYSYSNEALLNYIDNGDSKTINSEKVTVPVSVQLISKTGKYDAANKKIDWTITVNESGRTIDNAKVIDVIPAGLKLIDGSVEVGSTSDSVQPVSDSSYTYDYTDNETDSTFIYDLGNITEEKVIEFSTSIDIDVYNSNNKVNYKNTATLTGDGVSEGTSATKGVGVRPSIIKKVGSSYNASNGIITWEITVNSSETNISSGAVVTDNIPKGQEYVAGSTKLDGTSIADSGCYTQASDEDPDKTGTIEYTFSSAFSDTHTIIFQTQITDPSVYRANYSGTYKNTVNFKANGVDESSTGSQTVTSEVIKKTGEGYDYSTREITWQIVVNKNKMPITNAVVMDSILDGQEYVEGSTEINGSKVEDSLVNNPKTTGLFIYGFGSETINDTQTITFKTKITDLDIFNENSDQELKNTASITADEIHTDGNSTSTGTETVKSSVISKIADYTVGNSYIDWTVETNSNWSIPLAGATITDTLQDGLSLDTDTVELYKASVNSDGSLTKGDKVQLTSENVKYDPDTRVFEFTFPEDLEAGAFMLKFTTNVTNKGNYSNSVQFKGSGVEVDSSATQNGVWFSQGGGGATGETGSITVTKVADDGVTPLSGAVFELLDQYGNVKETSDPTGDDGSVTFDNLKYNLDYSIREKTAPTGYNLSSEVYTFQISSSGDKDITYTYKDTVKRADIQFTKIGEDSDVDGLEGVEFTLYQSDGTTPVKDDSGNNITAVSDEDGVVEFKDVAYGKYVIKETNRPENYNSYDNAISVDLTAITDGEVVDLGSITDNKIRNDIQFKKVDESGNPLKGAVFTLYKINEDGTLTAVKDSEGNDLTATSGSDDVEGATDTTGNVIFEDVEYGSYEIKETVPPSGYNTSTTPLYANVSVDKTVDSTPVYARPEGNTETGLYSLSDTKVTGGGGGSIGIRGTVSVKKVDENGDPLSGAVFTLYKLNGTEVMTATTDESGVAKFYKVLPGKYSVKETVAPSKYTLSTKVISVEINMSKVYDIGTVQDTKDTTETGNTDETGNTGNTDESGQTEQTSQTEENSPTSEESNSEKGSSETNAEESGSSTLNSEYKKTLPKTGSIIDGTVLTVIGVLFILLGSVLMVIKKKKI
ncbi:LPXTG cell wall anchor domain-containing protein [Clostridium sp. cel8]|uniref:SpaA isopeptide-forming pilin-related protein n=1 Tax=Clostridium sp. cel8 TaxID=2663123 RepID=UPI0015F5AF49|nr:SpaA isopeptide-forming pilin-related protein [Clostridium sp. cel8]MBA5851139.1 LPXTG cell wall anchor domain-containing protein [Clostridium sp. cel8]